MKDKFQLIVNIMVIVMFAGLLMGAGVYLKGTSGVNFELDYDNVGAGASQTITFNRGSTGTIDAILTFDETNDRFEYNFPLQSRLFIHLEGEVGADGSAGGKTVSYMDDSPDGEFTDSEGNGKVTFSNDATYYKMASNSLKMVFAADALVEDGAAYVAGQPYDWTDDENLGFWIYSSIALDANDLAFELQDDGAEQVILVGAISATAWTWVSLTLPGANADKDVISEIRIVQKVDKGAMDIYVDAVFKWDSAEEVDLTYDILDDGDFSCLADVTAGGAWGDKVRYTNYFVDYDSTDHLVFITDESANKLIFGYAYE